MLLNDVYEFKWNKEQLADFCEALVLEERLLDATSRPVHEVRDAVARRTQRIRTDLLRFIRGEESLQDGDTDAPLHIGPWHGGWTIETVDKKEGPWSGTMDLHQDGDRLTGTYGQDTSIEATIYRDVVEGEWSEPGDSGRFRWWLTNEGGAFDGTWGRRSHRRGRGTRRGRKLEQSGVPTSELKPVTR